MGFELVIEDNDNNTFLQIDSLKKMIGTLRKLDDGKMYWLTQTFTKIGKENCDINVFNPLVELRHAVIEYDSKLEYFVIEDLNTPHGTYVNDCRVQNAKVKIAHGDIIRLGHGGPQFEVLFDVNSNPPVVMQQVWQEPSKNTNLPYLPLQSNSSNTVPTSKQYSTVSYGRSNGYYGHNKTTSTADPTDVMPRPPVRQRPLSANPTRDSKFLSSSAKASSLARDLPLTSARASDYVMDLEAKLLKMGDEISRLAAFEGECFRKDSVIVSLRNEIEMLQNTTMSEENIRTLSLLQNQVSLKNDDIQRLQDENRKWKHARFENEAANTNQISEMKTLLVRHDQNISVMENEMKKMHQEKMQLSKLITTLQKENSAKDTLLKRSKTETEKYRLECRNKDMEISSLIAKIQKQTVSEQVKKELKKKEEELSSIRYRMKKADDKVHEKELTIQNLRNQISMSSEATENLQNSLKIMEQENTRYRSKCFQWENSEQSNRVEVDTLKRKNDNFVQQVRQLVSLEGHPGTHYNNNYNIRNEDDVIAFIQDLRKDRKQCVHQMEEALNEKARLENSMISDDAMHKLRSCLYDIESRLSRNSRSCANLRNELQALQDVEASEKLHWVKDFVISMLTQEYKWELEIENALEAVKSHTDDSLHSDPTTLIHRLHVKLNDNLQKLDEVESKISTSEEEYSKLSKEFKKEMKEKYKKKLEKSLEEVKYDEKLRYEKEFLLLREQTEQKLQLELKAKEQQMRSTLSMYQLDSENANILKQKISKLEKEVIEEQSEKRKSQHHLEESKRNERLLENKLSEQNNEFQIHKDTMERTFKSYESAEQSILKDKAREKDLTIKSLESTLLDINREKKEVEDKFQKMKTALKEQKTLNKRKDLDEEMQVIQLKKGIEELKDKNKILKHNASNSQKDCEEQKEITKTLKMDLEGLSTKLTDLRGEIQDEEKRKVEDLQEKLEKQELDHMDQRKQLIKMSALVEEQQSKLTEQDTLLKKQNDTLAHQADGLSIQAAVKKVDRTPENIRMVGQRCLSQRHDQVIAKQKMSLSELRNSVNSLDHQRPPKTKTSKHRGKNNSTM